MINKIIFNLFIITIVSFIFNVIVEIVCKFIFIYGTVLYLLVQCRRRPLKHFHKFNKSFVGNILV